ncbi:MAG: roadblock/LC7 domain-containing protein, partial [Stenotrophomonas sp.]
MSKQEQLQIELDSLTRALGGLKGSFLCTLDGMPVAQSVTDPNIQSPRVAAMAATALGVGRRITETLSTGVLRGTQLTASEGRVFIYMIGDKACLALVAPSD